MSQYEEPIVLKEPIVTENPNVIFRLAVRYRMALESIIELPMTTSNSTSSLESAKSIAKVALNPKTNKKDQ